MGVVARGIPGGSAEIGKEVTVELIPGNNGRKMCGK